MSQVSAAFTLCLILGAGTPAGGACAQGLNDPTRPPAPAHAATARLPVPTLSGVLTIDGRRSAILEGHLVHAGSVLGPLTIDAVLADGVRYHDAHGVHELHLAAPTSIKKNAASLGTASGETHGF
jgi:hypothetical protein